ncbi:tumor necrosis factor receptor superfamily member 9 isoform X3 [Lates calcarifer]|uniref:Tumor necrosis factor receptor superfamily member 9 isoform X2 n=1 Tax=Lates calcarifer TaxID=8187 RepID=A0AAJ8BF13_LATCA|nr:tumor necrosis factor receptor superfamily member 9 isoform X2 [Lates calcarifer]XP_050930443.1 tumor necrosis factor receptor superfamily member 9 isoform X3 [Lates calcarifer]
MVLLKLLIFTLTFNGFIFDLDAITCPKGQRPNRRRNGCEPCPDGYYQDGEECIQCTHCEEDRGSFVAQRCTKQSNTKCECRRHFVSWGETDSSTCKCDIGFGLVDRECEECKEGYFNARINSPCQKWRECKSGVKTSGTRTSDVVCNELESDLDITSPYITSLTSHPPNKGTQTLSIHTTTAATTAAPPGHTVTTKKTRKPEPSPSPNTGNHFGMVLLMVGIVGLLLILTAVTCKHFVPCVLRKPTVQMKDSCRRPVEESGDDSLCSVKLYAKEP